MTPLTQRTDYQSVLSLKSRPVVGTFIRLWDQAAPLGHGDGPADIPAMIAFTPPNLPAKCATVVVCPGGGYWGLAEHEADPVAQWLNSIGIAAFVLRYRLGANNYRHPAMLMDAARAIRTVRAMAGPWQLDAGRVGILGFSAGGHLASTAATQFEPADAGRKDPMDRVSSRPDLAILVYPVITFTGPMCHEGSCANLLGPDASIELRKKLSSHLQVTAATPPCFFVHSTDDKAVPVENSIMMAEALARYQIPHEVVTYDHGGHGYGLGGNDSVLSQWPGVCAKWLRTHKFCKAS